MAHDRFGRNVHYLRVSLTDRCNLRCVYCMPEDMTFRPRSELMQDDELVYLVGLFTELGFDKFRLTGGEPTVRANVVELVYSLAAAPGVRSLSMTTNGLLLERLAAPLAAAGLQRVNISLDTLNPARFRRITRWGRLADLWAGIEAVERAGLAPIKLNAVVVRGFNEQDVADLAALTLAHPWQVRFIEMMPFGDVADLQRARVVRAREMRALIRAKVGPLRPLGSSNGGSSAVPLFDGEARLYQFENAPGAVGFIAPVTEPFCAACTRARLTADGRLRMCLLREQEVDLLTPLRAGATAEELKQLIRAGVWRKPWGHDLARNVVPLNRTMSEIGG